jgi:hypothetical protein
METITINFNSDDIKSWDYSKMILESVRNHLFLHRNVEYIFPQIKKWWHKLKNQIANWLIKLWVKEDFNVWFVSTQIEEAVFKIIFNK